MIDEADFPFQETLTRVISAQTHSERPRTPTKPAHEATQTQTDPPGVNPTDRRNVTMSKTLSRAIKKNKKTQNSMLGTPSRHWKESQTCGPGGE